MKKLILYYLLSICLVTHAHSSATPDGRENANDYNTGVNATSLPAVGVGTATDYWSVLDKGISPPSPNAASLGIFGNIPVGMYKGTARYDIPLYTLKSAHLELPITLGYASNGLIVDAIASNIGLGWSLFTGGIINRTVSERPDEHTSYRLESKWLDAGLPLDASNPYRTALASFICRASDERSGVDAQQDIFQYNVSGLSGSFVLDDQMKPQVITGNGQVKIEFNRTSNQFTLTDTKGLKYYFTVTEKNRENIERISDKYKFLDSPSTVRTPPISHAPLRVGTTAWFITKIVHPQGDSLMFEYNSGSETYDYGYHEEIRAFYHSNEFQGTPNISPNLKKHMITYGYKRGIKDTRYIRKITATNGVTVEFGYNTGARKDMLAGGVLLTSFTVKHGQTVIKKFTFTQDAKISTQNAQLHLDGLKTGGTDIQYRYFLTRVSEKSIDNTKEIAYKFEYNDLDNLPNRFLRAQDYGGFYNGSTANRLAPCIVSGSGTSVTVTANDSNRTPNWQYAQKGVLKKITYPTGGTTVITYEANQKGTEVYPGLRVSKTEDNPGGDAPTVIRKYYYNDYAGRNTSSAIQRISKSEFTDRTVNYYCRPCIFIFGKTAYDDPPFFTYNYDMYYSSAKNYFNALYDALPCYPIVTVSYGGSNFEEGGTTTYFRNQGSDGCSYLTHRRIKFGVWDNSGMYDGETEREVSFKVENGVQKILMDKRFTYKEITTYTRNCLVIDSQYPDNAPLCGLNRDVPQYEKAFMNYALARYKMYGKVLLLDKVTTIIYDQNGQNPLETVESYTYNNYNQVATISTTGSDGKTHKIAMRYASDYFGISSSYAYYSVFNALKNKNRQEHIVEQVKYVGSNVVSASLNIYGLGSNGGVNIVQQYEHPIATVTTSHTFFNGTSYHSGYEKIWDFQYNSGNKLKEAIYKGSEKRAYIWGYQNCYLVAEVMNASFSSLGVSNQPLNGALPSGNENTIRALANTLVTTYTYKPQIGMETMIDPSLNTTYYDYDNFCRLKECYIKENGTKRTLQTYNYNYTNQ